jgi:hypothetical protein
MPRMDGRKGAPFPHQLMAVKIVLTKGSSAKIDGPGRLNNLANRYGLMPVG